MPSPRGGLGSVAPPFFLRFLTKSISVSVSLCGPRGDPIPRKTLEAYSDIAETLFKAHGIKPFRRAEVDSLLLQELDILREETKAAHIRTMISLKYLVLVELGTAYQDSTYRLGDHALQLMRTTHARLVPLPKARRGRPRR